MDLTVDMTIEGLSYIEVMMINSNVHSARICVIIVLLIVYLPESV